MAKNLRVGLVGAGWVGQARHIPSLLARADVEIVAICDRHLDRAQTAASQCGSSTSVLKTQSFDALLAKKPDAVFIATPPWSHQELAVGALESGAHVFTEKPMAMNIAEATAMVNAAQKAERLLCVSHNFIFSRSAKKASKLIANQPLKYVFATQLSSEKRRLPSWYKELPGGLLFDEIPHLLYLVNHFAGGNISVEHIRSEIDDNFHPKSVELLYRGEKAIGVITVLFGAPVSEWHLSLVTEDTVVDVDLFRDVVVALPSDGRHGPLDIAKTSGLATMGHLTGSLVTGMELARKRQSWGHRQLISRFLDAIITNSPEPVPHEEALNVVRLSDQILKSLDQIAR